MGNLADSASCSVVAIHNFEILLDQCIKLINSEWPRSYNARLWSLKLSKDSLPTSMVLIKGSEVTETTPVLAHAKLSPVPSDDTAVFIESVIVDRQYRGQGLGRMIMTEVENHCFKVLRCKTAYLCTIDKEGFYERLGYTLCKAINLFGIRKSCNNSTKKIWLKKTVSEWKQQGGRGAE